MWALHLQDQSSWWQNSGGRERGGGSHTYARSASTGNLQIASPKSWWCGPYWRGNFFSIGTPRHRVDPKIVSSQDTNQQKQRGKHLGKKNLKKKTHESECSVTGHSQEYILKFTFISFSSMYLSKTSYLCVWFACGKFEKTYHSEWPVNWQSRDRLLTGHSQTYTLKSFTFISFSSMHLSTKSSLFE